MNRFRNTPTEKLKRWRDAWLDWGLYLPDEVLPYDFKFLVFAASVELGRRDDGLAKYEFKDKQWQTI